MLFKGCQANATGEDVAQEDLKRYGAINVVSLDGGDYPEFEWESYCDSDTDVLDVLSVALWYNDRSHEQIERIRAAVKTLLKNERPNKRV